MNKARRELIKTMVNTGVVPKVAYEATRTKPKKIFKRISLQQEPNKKKRAEKLKKKLATFTYALNDYYVNKRLEKYETKSKGEQANV